MSMKLELELPWPPSTNRYWRHPTSGPLAGRHLISEDGRRYRKAVVEICRGQAVEKLINRVSVEIDAYPPDHRRRDLDNLTKALLDSIVHAGVIVDDWLVDRLVIVRRGVLPPGRVVVTISEESSDGGEKNA